MKNLIIIFLMLTLLGVYAMGAQKDTLTVKGKFYLDGEQVSIGIIDGKIVKIDLHSQSTEAPEVYVSPGLVDLQINGFVGVDFSDQNLTIEGIRKA
ncbi:MAG: hypothetical protein M1292_04045, partial [Bacteroidetes bacterium]|nr:hypothetical protein [Bacteroidota bacterium]